MPKALFFNVPGHGHVNPSLPLVAELVRRGHHITYFATGSYRARIEAAGAAFHSYTAVEDDYFESRGLHGGVPQRVATALLTTTEKILPELLETARRAQPDYILYDGMCMWGYFVAQILKLPAVVSLALMPLPEGSPPPGALLNFDLMRAMLPMIFRDFRKGVEANRRSRALAKHYGIPPLGLTSMLNAPGDLVISHTSSYFPPFADRVSDTVLFVGRTIDESPADDSLPFEPAPGKRLVYVSLGTLNNDDAGFFRACIDAFTGSDEVVLMSTGNRINPASFGTLPENIRIEAWVPQIAVLKRAALFITHGGLNSVHDGLYFGVPLLLVPQQEEQTMTALRVTELGAGLLLRKGQVNAESIRAAAARLLTDTRFRSEARKIGETFRTAGGVTRAADEIETLLRNRAVS